MDAGIKLLYGLGVAADADKGKRLQQRALDIGPKACEAGDVFACERLGIVYFRGYGVNIDAPRAVAMFGRACELDRDPNNQDAIAIAALSACNVRNGVAARNYLARITGQRRALVRQVCIQNGLHVD
jgi:TPR repeat protein